MSDEMTVDDVMSRLGDLEDKIDGLADEFDTMGDEHDQIKWYVAEMSAAMQPIVLSIRALATAIDRLAQNAGVSLSNDPAPELFIPPNRAQRRQDARRNGKAV